MILARPYQVAALEANKERIADGKDPLTSLFTGAGKGFTMAFLGQWIADTFGGRVGYLCHRSELADQIESNLRIVDPHHAVGREQGETRSDTRGNKPRYVVAMIQSIGRKSSEARLKSFRPEDFSAWITDEGHHGTAPIYKRHAEHFRTNKKCRFAGFSATWINGAGEGIGINAGYNSVAYRMSLLDGIKVTDHPHSGGWLVRPQCWPMHPTGIDWGAIKVNNEGILDESAVEKAMLEEKPFHELTLMVNDRTKKRRSLIYGPGKMWNKAAFAVFQKYVGDDVRRIDDDTPEDERDAAVNDFRGGVYSKLLNVGILTEGTDIPVADCAVLCRPCQSDVLLTQIVGRPLRPVSGLLDHPDVRDRMWSDPQARIEAIANSAKPNALILDMAARGARKIITVTDILGSDQPAGVVDYAKRIAAQEDGAVDPLANLDRAGLEWALIQEEIKRRSKVKANGVSYETHEVDLFDPRQAAAPMPTANQTEPASDAQQNLIIENLGWTKAKTMSLSKKQASAIIAGWKSGKIKPVKNHNVAY